MRQGKVQRRKKINKICKNVGIPTSMQYFIMYSVHMGAKYLYLHVSKQCYWFLTAEEPIATGKRQKLATTVEPRFNEPPFNEVLDITNENLRPGQNYSKMYGIEPRYNEPRFSEFFDITNIIRKPKRKIYLDITNYSVDTRHNINAEQINSQQVL